MSKYLMNKLIHLVKMNEAVEKEYAASPREFAYMIMAGLLR